MAGPVSGVESGGEDGDAIDVQYPFTQSPVGHCALSVQPITAPVTGGVSSVPGAGGAVFTNGNSITDAGSVSEGADRSSTQMAEHPSPGALLPSSQISSGESKTPSPQRLMRQSGLHLALGTFVLPIPSSHSSPLSNVPLPQKFGSSAICKVVKQAPSTQRRPLPHCVSTVQSPHCPLRHNRESHCRSSAQDCPSSLRQRLLHPSPENALPSSHVSPDSILPFPQKGSTQEPLLQICPCAHCALSMQGEQRPAVHNPVEHCELSMQVHVPRMHKPVGHC